jgi:hypothetical protein
MTLPKTLTTLELMSLSGYPRPTLTDFEAQGVIKRSARGQWPTLGTIKGLIMHLCGPNRRGHAGPRQALQEAKTKEVLQKIEIRNRGLIPRKDVDVLLDKVCEIVRIEFGGLPSRFAHDPAVRAALEKTVDESLERVAKTLGEFKKAARIGRRMTIPD